MITLLSLLFFSCAVHASSDSLHQETPASSSTAPAAAAVMAYTGSFELTRMYHDLDTHRDTFSLLQKKRELHDALVEKGCDQKAIHAQLHTLIETQKIPFTVEMTYAEETEDLKKIQKRLQKKKDATIENWQDLITAWASLEKMFKFHQSEAQKISHIVTTRQQALPSLQQPLEQSQEALKHAWQAEHDGLKELINLRNKRLERGKRYCMLSFCLDYVTGKMPDGLDSLVLNDLGFTLYKRPASNQPHIRILPLDDPEFIALLATAPDCSQQ